MAGCVNPLVLGVAIVTSTCAWANAPARHHHSSTVATSSPIRHQPAVIHRQATVQVLAPVVALPYVNVRPVFTTNTALPRAAPPAANTLYVVTPPPNARVALADETPVSPRIWNFSRVESIVALAGHHDTRQYCPDTRRYHPDVQTCASPWLKVIP